jgi:hypothetical protein
MGHSGFGLVDPVDLDHNIAGNVNGKFVDLLIREFQRIRTVCKMTKFKKKPSATTSDWGLLLLQDKSTLALSPPSSSTTTSEANTSICSDKFAYRISLQKPTEQSSLVQILRELLGVEFQGESEFHEARGVNCQGDDMEDMQDMAKDMEIDEDYQPSGKKPRYNEISDNNNLELPFEIIGTTPEHATWLGRRKLRRLIQKECSSSLIQPFKTPIEIEKIVTERIIQTTPKLTTPPKKFIMTITDRMVQFDFETAENLRASTDFLHFTDTFLLKML